MTSSEGTLRAVVAVAAWTTLAVVLLSFIGAAVPTVGVWLATPAPGSLRELGLKGLTLLVTVVLLGGWVGVIWHAAVNPRFQSVGHRAVVIGLLVFATLSGAFFYYFAYLRWMPKDGRAPTAV